jgi:hypothetical protein
MVQNELLTKNVAAIGEEISHELAAKLVKDYQDCNPTDLSLYTIGKDILNEILSQPGCAGIRFYNALNEEGSKTLVYVGINEQGENIVEYNVINGTGQLDKQKGIVADRTDPFGDSSGWGWFSEA